MLFWILLILAFAVLTALFFRLIRSFWKGFLSALGMISLVLVILSLFVYLDAIDFSENMQSSPTLYILEEDGKMLAAVKDITIPDENAVNAVSDEEFSYHSALYEKEDYRGMLGSRYKVFMISMDAFAALDDSDFGKHEGFSKELVFSMLRSESAVDTYIDNAVESAGVSGEYREVLRKNLREQLSGESEMRSSMFMIMIESLMAKDPLFMITEYKKGAVDVYPVSMLFRAVGVMPSALLDRIGSFVEKKQGGGAEA